MRLIDNVDRQPPVGAHDDDRAASAAALDARRCMRVGEPIVMLTAYDYPSARVAVAGGVDVVLVGDSAAMTVLGYTSTREITVDELLMLTRAVRRAVTDIPVIGDLPFGSYEDSDERRCDRRAGSSDEARLRRGEARGRRRRWCRACGRSSRRGFR